MFVVRATCRSKVALRWGSSRQGKAFLAADGWCNDASIFLKEECSVHHQSKIYTQVSSNPHLTSLSLSLSRLLPLPLHSSVSIADDEEAFPEGGEVGHVGHGQPQSPPGIHLFLQLDREEFLMKVPEVVCDARNSPTWVPFSCLQLGEGKGKNIEWEWTSGWLRSREYL